MTIERANQLLNQPVLTPFGSVVVLRGIFTDEQGNVCGMCYGQRNGKDDVGMSFGLEELDEVHCE